MAEGRRSKQSMVVWSSLRMDLVRKVSDSLLATSDVVSYMEMRAVCHNWRVAIPKPPPLSGVTDHRFRPRGWIMLDEETPCPKYDHCSRLFLHLSTGRILRLRIPQLGPRLHDEHSHILVGASDGLLVLGGRKGVHPARLLNPFTGDLMPFLAPIPQERNVLTAVAGSSSSPTLLFSFEDWCMSFFHDLYSVYCADATSSLCEVQFEGCGDNGIFLRCLISYAGHFYMFDYYRGIFKVVGTAPRYRAELIVKTSHGNNAYYLVESAGELLLVGREWSGRSRMARNVVQVCRVNIKQKVLEPVTSIGSQALFLGVRSLSVDADKLPSVDSNCIYHVDAVYDYDDGCNVINRYDLSNSRVERFSCVFEGGEPIRPFSIVQTLLSYCVGNVPDICAQVKRVKDW